MNKLTIASFIILCLTMASCTTKPTGGEIDGTYWNLSSYKIGNKSGALDENSKITAVFSANKVVGQSVCNDYQGRFSTEVTDMTVSEVEATEKMCEAMNVEQIFMDLLSKTTAYSVTENKLLLHCENGMLTFSAMSAAEVANVEYAGGIGKLVNLFPSIEGALPHFYPIVRVDRPGNYPYVGQLVAPSFYSYFDAKTSDIWDGGGDVMAIGKYDDFYICRVPGRYVSSDIALFQLKDGVLKRSETIAWAWCDEGWCNQQDAWLQDLDKNGRIDIVQRYKLTNDLGKIVEERMTFLLQNEKGVFEPSEDIEVSIAQYPMAGI